MTSAITPDPGIHNFPPLDSTAFTIQDFQQLEVWAQQLLEGIANWIVLALDNINIYGLHPFLQLQAFGQQVASAVAQLEALIVGVGGAVIADVVAAIKIGQQAINAICVALGAPARTTGGALINYSYTDVLYYLENIPNTVVTSVLGGKNLGDDVFRHADAILSGITDDVSRAAAEVTGTIGYLENQWTFWTKSVFGYHSSAPGVVDPPQAQSTNAIAQTQAGFNKGQATNKPIANNIDPTLDPVFHLSTVATTMPTIPVTQSSSVIGYISIPDVSATKDEIAIIGYPTGSMSNFTGFYLNLYSMSPTTGAMTWLYTTENLQGQIPGAASGTFKGVWYYYNVPSTSTTVSGVTKVTACVIQTINLGFGRYNSTNAASFGGTYTLTFGSATTTTLNWNDSAATVQSALAALSGIGSGNVSVTNVNPNAASVSYGGPFIVTFCGSLANTAQTMLTINSSLTGNTDTAAVTPYLGVYQGDVYAVELVVVGAGTYNLLGQTSLIPNISSSYPQSLGASRTASAASPTPPTRDAVGTGNKGQTTSTTHTITWSHTIASSVANGGALVAMVSIGAAPSSVACSVGGTAMTQVSLTAINGGIYMASFIMQNPPTGTKTVSFTANFASSTTSALAGNSVSYLDVGGYSTAQTTTGNSAAPSQLVTAAAGATVIQGFFGASSGNFASYTSPENTLWNQAGIANSNYPMEIGDESGLSTATFATTCTSGYWGAIAVQLYGALYLPGASIASPAYSQTTPWFALSGQQSVTTYPPVLTTFTSSTNFTPPAWANSIDIVAFGGGGGGWQWPSGYTGYTGNGGSGGGIGTVTITKSSLGGTWPSLTVTVGSGGSGGVYSTTNTGPNPTGGSASQVLNGSTQLCRAAGGPIASSWYMGGTQTGGTPGNKSYDGNTYYGGVVQTAFSANGNAPGGGGSGGEYGSGAGGSGAQGAVFILAYS